MAQVIVDPNKPIDVALARFKKQVEGEKIMQELRKREFAQTKSQKRRIKSIEARNEAKKARSKRRQQSY